MRIIRRILSGLALAVAAVLGTAFWIDHHVADTASSYILSPEQVPGADAILVLGASVRANGQASPMLRDRLDRALELYRVGAAPKILVSGDHRSADYDETGAMKRYLSERKVPAKNIFMDHAGLSTYESMYRAQHMFEVRKVIIVTQSYHLKRAVYVARSLGLDAYGVAADATDDEVQDKFRIREFFARNKDFVYSRILKPEPPLVGDKMPISGDGRMTAKP